MNFFVSRGFLLFDLILVVCFCVLGVWEFSSNPLFWVVAAFTVFSLYPVWTYLSSVETEHDRTWHLYHFSYPIIICFWRAVLIILTLIIAICTVSQIDFVHTFAHLSVLTYVSVALMLFMYVCILTATVSLLLHHKFKIQSDVQETPIIASIHYPQTYTPTGTERFNRLADLKLSSAPAVVLIPNSREPNRVNQITMLANTPSSSSL